MEDIVPPNKKSIRNISLNQSDRIVPREYQAPVKRTTSAHERLSYTESDHEGHTKRHSHTHHVEEKAEIVFEEPESARKTKGHGHGHHKTAVPAAVATVEREYEYKEQETDEYVSAHSPLRTAIKYGAIFLVLLGLIGGGFYVYAIKFGGATITVIPKTEAVSVDNALTLAAADFKVFEGSRSVTFTVAATGQANVTTKARGTITVYNEYSDTVQRFVATTRFQTSDGKVYRTPAAVAVPGYTMQAGKKVPGSVAIQVIADVAGPSHNISTGTLTLPGLKGDVRFDTVYAKVTSPISGGSQGMQPVVSQADVARALASSTVEGQKILGNELASRIPSDQFVILPSLIFYEVGTAELASGQASSTTSGTSDTQLAYYEAQIKAHAIGIARRVMDTFVLTNSRQKTTLKDVIVVKDWSGLKAVHERKTQGPWTEKEQKLRVSGTVDVEWYFNSEQLVKDVAGKSLSALPAVLESYIGIQNAEATSQPFWNRKFPSDTALITVKTASIDE